MLAVFTAHAQGAIAQRLVMRQECIKRPLVVSIEQVGFIQQQQRLNMAIFGRHQIAVDEIYMRPGSGQSPAL